MHHREDAKRTAVITMASTALFTLGVSCNAGRVSLGDLTIDGDAGQLQTDASIFDGATLDGQTRDDAAKTCRSDWDCDDSDPCTVDDCIAGRCSNAVLNCDDQDDCTTDTCDDSGQCHHEPACDTHATCLDRRCRCNEGYTGDGSSCRDRDECSEGTALCDPNARCENTEGSYLCHCNQGYVGDGFTCTETHCPDGTCSQDEDARTCPQDCDFDLVLVSTEDLAATLTQDYVRYQQDARTQGKKVIIETWASGDASQLKRDLWAWVDRYQLSGAWLVGDFPAAWYEQTAFNAEEQFPCDLFLESRDATWTDQDANGRYDGHGDLHADIFVSRLIASSPAQYHAYFDKNHAYRTNGSLTRKAAFLFFDDDWSAWAGNYALNDIYATIDSLSDPGETTRNAYLDELTQQGAEFVYQWIHSTPTSLVVSGTGGGTIPASTVSSNNLQGTFYNLYDCSASRFTTNCLAWAYLTGTDYGLATVGTTKVGGMYVSTSFHNGLAQRLTWGEAFVRWYESQGRYDDEWFLGMVILGDPLLTIDKDPSLPNSPSPASLRQPTAQQMLRLRLVMERQAQSQPADTFEDYEADHPEFFFFR